MSLQSANNIGALPRRTTDGATTWWRSWYYNSTILLKCRLEDNVATLLLMKNIYMYIISQHVKPRKLWQFLHFVQSPVNFGSRLSLFLAKSSWIRHRYHTITSTYRAYNYTGAILVKVSALEICLTRRCPTMPENWLGPPSGSNTDVGTILIDP